MKSSPGFLYTGKIWLITILIAPVVLFLILSTGSNTKAGDYIETLPLLGVVVFCSIFLSVPSFLVSWGLVNRLKDGDMKSGIKKGILFLTLSLLVTVSFLLMSPDFFLPISFGTLVWPGAYIITLLAAVMIFPFPSQTGKILPYE